MANENKLLALLPRYFQEIENFATLCEVEWGDFFDLRFDGQAVNDNNFVQTCDEDMLAAMRSLLGIVWFTQFTTDELREVVLNQLAELGPFSEPALRKALARIMKAAGYEVPEGYEEYPDGFVLTVFPEEYRIEITIFSGRSGVLEVVKGLLHRWLPAHFEYTLSQVVKHTPTVESFWSGYIDQAADIGLMLDARAGE